MSLYNVCVLYIGVHKCRCTTSVECVHKRANVPKCGSRGSCILDPGYRILDPVSRILDTGSMILDPGLRSLTEDPEFWILDPGSRILSQDPESWILDHSSWIIDPSSWWSLDQITDPGSWTRTLMCSWACVHTECSWTPSEQGVDKQVSIVQVSPHLQIVHVLC